MESYCVFVHMRCLEVNELLQKTVYFYLHHQFQTNREKEIDTQFQTTTKYILIPASDRNIYSRVFLFFNSFLFYFSSDFNQFSVWGGYTCLFQKNRAFLIIAMTYIPSIFYCFIFWDKKLYTALLNTFIILKVLIIFFWNMGELEGWTCSYKYGQIFKLFFFCLKFKPTSVRGF